MRQKVSLTLFIAIFLCAYVAWFWCLARKFYILLVLKCFFFYFRLVNLVNLSDRGLGNDFLVGMAEREVVDIEGQLSD